MRTLKYLAIAFLSTASMPASTTTFNLSTLNDYITGSGRSAVNHGYFTGPNGTGTEIFNAAGSPTSPSYSPEGAKSDRSTLNGVQIKGIQPTEYKNA